MVPFKFSWVIVINSNKVAFIGEQKNSQEKWIYLGSVWRVNHLTEGGLLALFNGTTKVGKDLGRDVWVETSGAEVYPLKGKPSWMEKVAENEPGILGA